MDVETDEISLDASSLSSISNSSVYDIPEVSSVTPFAFTPADQELLVQLVKLAQKRSYSSSRGTWAEYLERNLGSKVKDPAKHPWNVLADFIEDLSNPRDRKSIQTVIDWERKIEEDEELMAPALEAALLDSPSEGSMWNLVHRSSKHPRFNELYGLPSHEDGWVRARSTPSFDQEPTLLAVDCEMCITEGDDKALLSLCVVDADANEVLHEMVKPEGKVKDYLTAITGHTAADLVNVTYSRSDAQQGLLRHLQASDHVVLVGHALHHDLRALRLDYRPVIDTSLLLPYKDMPNASPALTDLVTRLLGRQLRQAGAPHDVAADARATMDLALYEHQKGPTASLEAPALEVTDEDRKRLLVHSMPAGMRDVDIIFLFPPGCPPISDIQRESKLASKAFVVFGSATDSQAAFDMLEGRLVPDSRNRAQKVVKVPAATAFKNMQVRIRVLHFDAIISHDPSKQGLPNRPVGSKRKFAESVLAH